MSDQTHNVFGVPDEITHRYVPSLGSVDIKIAHGRDAVSVEIDVTRPREGGESWDAACAFSAEVAAEAYRSAVAELAKLGVEVGPFRKQAGA